MQKLLEATVCLKKRRPASPDPPVSSLHEDRMVVNWVWNDTLGTEFLVQFGRCQDAQRRRLICSPEAMISSIVVSLHNRKSLQKCFFLLTRKQDFIGRGWLHNLGYLEELTKPDDLVFFVIFSWWLQSVMYIVMCKISAFGNDFLCSRWNQQHRVMLFKGMDLHTECCRLILSCSGTPLHTYSTDSRTKHTHVEDVETRGGWGAFDVG